MFVATEWEMFYTHSKGNDELVDQISIDEKNKRYRLEINAVDMITDGEDGFGNEIVSWYVSRLVFDIIVHGIKDKGFIELKGEI